MDGWTNIQIRANGDVDEGDCEVFINESLLNRLTPIASMITWYNYYRRLFHMYPLFNLFVLTEYKECMLGSLLRGYHAR